MVRGWATRAFWYWLPTLVLVASCEVGVRIVWWPLRWSIPALAGWIVLSRIVWGYDRLRTERAAWHDGYEYGHRIGLIRGRRTGRRV